MVSLIIALPITDCQPKHEYQISWTSINEAKGFLRLLFYTFSRISLMQADFTPFNHEKCFQFRPQNQRQEQPTGYFKFCSYRSERIIEVENTRCIEFLCSGAIFPTPFNRHSQNFPNSVVYGRVLQFWCPPDATNSTQQRRHAATMRAVDTITVVVPFSMLHLVSGISFRLLTTSHQPL